MRNCVATLGIGTLVLGGVALFGADWRDKPSTDWTADEVTKILNDSPWSQKVRMAMGGGQQQGRGMGRGGGMGGPGGGGWGGRGGGMGGPGGGGGWGGNGGGGGWGGNGGGGQSGNSQQGGPREVLVRWQSAAPVQQALVKQQGSSATPSSDAQGQQAAAPAAATPAAAPDSDYIIAVAGLPEWQGRRRQDADSDNGNSGQSDEDRRQAFLDRLKQSSTLTAKGKSPLGPEKVERASDGTVLFYFPKSEQPLSLDDHEVEFATRLGPMDLKHTFKLKDMKYQGKLAL